MKAISLIILVDRVLLTQKKRYNTEIVNLTKEPPNYALIIKLYIFFGQEYLLQGKNGFALVKLREQRTQI